MWETISTDIYLVGGPEEEKRRGTRKNKNVPNLSTNINIHIQEAQWNSVKIKTKQCTKRHFNVKILKNEGKEKILKSWGKNDSSLTREPQ